MNKGINPITGLTITWDDGSGPNVDNITGLNILSNQTYDFTSPTQLNVVGGINYPIDVNVTFLADGDSTNNDLSKPIYGLDSIPKKYVVGEEKTGTWCGWCPRGAVALANMESESDFIGIAVHNGDPMTISSYNGSIGTYVPGGYPGAGVDRVEIVDLKNAGFLPKHNIRIATAIPCDIKNITAVYNPTSNDITVSAESEWYGNIAGDYRLSCVIVEDDIIETGTNWMQNNYYSGGASGVMAFPAGINYGYDFSTGADPEDPAQFGGYDHVARSLSNDDILGDTGSLPAGLVPLGIHSHTFDPVSANLMKDLNNCHAIVMVVNSTSGEILNAYKAAITGGGVGIVELENNLELKLYPNPAQDYTIIELQKPMTEESNLLVYNSLGQKVKNLQIAKNQKQIRLDLLDLESGFYYFELRTENGIVGSGKIIKE